MILFSQTQLMIKDESKITTFVEFLICADALGEEDPLFGTWDDS